MNENGDQLELQVFQDIVSALSKLEKDARVRMLQSVITFLAIEPLARPQVSRTEPSLPGVLPEHRAYHTFSGQADLSPKEFMRQKEPRTDIERVACLAYYLTHYRGMPQFTTLDISKLNTEAAQQKFSNAAQALKNTTNKGLIVQTGKGQKQISADGEQFVAALPDRAAAKTVLDRMGSRRRRRTRNGKRESAKRA